MILSIQTLFADPGSLLSEAGLAHWWRSLSLSQTWGPACMTQGDAVPDGDAVWAAADLRDIAAARLGDSEAFRRLVERYQTLIAIQMRRFSREPLVCEELVHDVFVSAYCSLHSYRGNAPWLHWIRKIAVRVGYRYWTERRNGLRTEQLSSTDWQRLQGKNSEPIAAQESADLVSKLLSQLPPADRLVLTLLYVEDCSMAEAASRAGWTVMGAKMRAFRARRKLQSLIQRGDR